MKNVSLWLMVPEVQESVEMGQHGREQQTVPAGTGNQEILFSTVNKSSQN